jgi:hypothetical protein
VDELSTERFFDNDIEKYKNTINIQHNENPIKYLNSKYINIPKYYNSIPKLRDYLIYSRTNIKEYDRVFTDRFSILLK